MNQSNQVQHCSRWIKQQVHVEEGGTHTLDRKRKNRHNNKQQDIHRRKLLS